MTASADPDVRLRAINVSKRYCRDLGRATRYGVHDLLAELVPRRREERADLRPGEFWALEDISLELGPGEAIGVVGANGSGKTTLLRVLHGLTKPDGGTVEVRGQVAALIDVGTSFVPHLTGRENVLSDAALFGVPAEDVGALVGAVADFAEIGEALDAPVETYSSGMRLRLAFAIAAQVPADLLLVDEDVAVGDLAFQRKCVHHVLHHLERGGSLVLVSHDLWMVNALCDH
ncbi:hypothetical protein B7486_54225, partial [cyanobacterium TDX16]